MACDSLKQFEMAISRFIEAFNTASAAAIHMRQTLKDIDEMTEEEFEEYRQEAQLEASGLYNPDPAPPRE
jgi:hypothetical protein